jgi:carboxylesterase type B
VILTVAVDKGGANGDGSGAVIDGTYLTQPHLMVNTTGQSSNVTIITGINRNEAGVLVDNYPEPNSTFASYATKALARYNLNPSFLPSLAQNTFTTSSSSANKTDAILNATVAVSTYGEFACLDIAKAFTGAHSGAFKQAYVYNFNRTYQTSGYTRPWCVPPKTAERPNGDPDGEYMKCHAGEQLVVFGNVRRAGLPDRDGRDVSFIQLAVDYWAAFARTGDPNPDERWLEARGHWSSLQQVRARGKWEPVGAERASVRNLQWDGGQFVFGDADMERCRALGVPIDFLEK